MTLIATPDNPAPAGGLEAEILAADGVRLRTARWIPAGAARGTVAVIGGRNEFIEKYYEVVGELTGRGFAAAAFDWRGQGGSARPLKNPRKGHVDDFAHYERDLDAFVSQILERHCPRPWFALAHSMGAAVMFAAAQSAQFPFERIVLTSPMVALAGIKRPRAAHLTVELLDALGLGGAFAPGRGSTSPSTLPFAGNDVSSDPVRYARTANIVAANPDLALGWPTIGWLHSAFRHMRRFEDPNFARAIATPALIVASGADRVTDTRACERFAARLRSGRIIVVSGAEHELLMERDVFRDQFWAAFDQFVPGRDRVPVGADPNLIQPAPSLAR